MGNKKSSDEQSTPKQQYFVPKYGISVEAKSAEDAVKVAEKQVEQEGGDAE